MGTFECSDLVDRQPVKQFVTNAICQLCHRETRTGEGKREEGRGRRKKEKEEEGRTKGEGKVK